MSEMAKPVSTKAPTVRVEHALACSAPIRAHQKEWFANLRQRVADGEPYAIAPALGPHEIFEAFDMPYVINEWWSGITAARRQSGYFFDLLAERGYHRGLPSYGALALGSALEGESPNQPWGGLPKPAFVLYGPLDGESARWEALADAFGCEALPASICPEPAQVSHRWWEVSKVQWEDLYESRRINAMVACYQRIIRKCEQVTGRKFDMDKLREVMDRANKQEEAFDECRKIVQKAAKTPVSLADELGNVMTIQWHRGSQWALDAARMYRDEIRARAEAGIAICPDEKIRLGWVGVGLWQNVHFYRAFEQSHGAVFVRAMYQSIAVDGYIRYGLKDPLRALASRYVALGHEFSQPPASTEWTVDDVRRYRVDGMIILPLDHKFMEVTLERAGIPTMVLNVDAVGGGRPWDDQWVTETVSRFLEDRVEAGSGARRALV